MAIPLDKLETLPASETRIPPKAWGRAEFAHAPFRIAKKGHASLVLISGEDYEALRLAADAALLSKARTSLARHRKSGKGTPGRELEARLGVERPAKGKAVR